MAYEGRGLYLEDFEIGKTYESPGRTITEADVVNFAGLSGDFNPLHMDEEFGKNNMFGKRVAHGALGLIIATGMSNQTGLFEGTTIAFLELTAKIYSSPVHRRYRASGNWSPQRPLTAGSQKRGILKDHGKNW